jgi:hypothetical protein
VSTWGVYVAGPGIRGWILLRRPPGAFETFPLERMAVERAKELQAERPHHHVRAKPYVAGDELLGELLPRAPALVLLDGLEE